MQFLSIERGLVVAKESACKHVFIVIRPPKAAAELGKIGDVLG